MKKRLLTALFGVLSVCAAAFADDVNYSGTVVSKSGEPIMGATVTVTGTTVSTITDMDGNFSLVVPDGYTTVTVTYSGMKKQTVSIQREPVILYESAEQAEQARLLALKNNKKSLSKPYKKNAFNFEIGVGGALGDWSDAAKFLMDENYSSSGDTYVTINLGYHHGFNQYIAWEVLNVGAYAPVENLDDNFINAYATTGIKLTTPRWKKLSLSYSFNLGADYDGYTEYVNFTMRHKISLNFGKWCYIAFNYNIVNLKDESKEYYNDDLNYYSNHGYYDSYGTYHSYGSRYYGNSIDKIEVGSFALGFNF